MAMCANTFAMALEPRCASDGDGGSQWIAGIAATFGSGDCYCGERSDRSNLDAPSKTENDDAAGVTRHFQRMTGPASPKLARLA